MARASQKPLAIALITGLFAIVLAVLWVSTGPWWLSGEVAADAHADAGPDAGPDAADDAGRVQMQFVRVLIDPDSPVSGEIASAIHEEATRSIHSAGLTEVPSNIPIGPNVATLTVSLTEHTRDESHVVVAVSASITRGHDSGPSAYLSGRATGTPPPGTEPTSELEVQVLVGAVRAALGGLRRALGLERTERRAHPG